MSNDRKSQSVWLKDRQLEMLRGMPELTASDLLRKAIEEAFEGRHDREYARICIEDDLESVLTEWGRTLGMASSYTLTSTEDGFRVVIVGLKKFDS